MRTKRKPLEVFLKNYVNRKKYWTHFQGLDNFIMNKKSTRQNAWKNTWKTIKKILDISQTFKKLSINFTHMEDVKLKSLLTLFDMYFCDYFVFYEILVRFLLSDMNYLKIW